jgi:hypothetical protein
MSHPDEPAAPPAPETAIQASTPPAPQQPTAPAEPPITAEALGRARWQIDCFLVLLLLVLAFALASFAIQNSDFWMHLATGRALTRGTYNVFAANDPFSYTTEGVRWINHSWLYDWGAYGLYRLLGGPGLVVLKGVLIVLLAIVLFQIRRAGQSLWAPVVCVGVALLALSPRLQLQPVIFSYLFLGITLLVLTRAGNGPDRLPVLFALWANLDVWFILGPLTVALFLVGGWIGRLLGAGRKVEVNNLRRLSLVLVVGLAACLVNPSGVYVFALPADLAYLVVQLTGPMPSPFLAGGTSLYELAQVDPSQVPLFTPLLSAYWQPNYGLNVAGISYFVLLGLGILSFLLAAPVRTRGRDEELPIGFAPRLVVWLVFTLLSLLLERLIPFFAVVAGPITALNFQDFAQETFGTKVRTAGPWRLWSLGGRLATVAVFLGLLFLAWPGWLHALPDDARYTHRIAWHIYEDPSLRQAAQRLAELQQSGKLAHGFNINPDMISYLAWFSPGCRGFLDRRSALFAGVAEQYGQTRKALLEEGEYFARAGQKPPLPPPHHDWQHVFKARNISYVIASGPSRDRSALANLTLAFWIDRGSWVPLYLDGQTSIFGWTGDGVNSFAGLEWDLNRLAFGPVPEDSRAPLQAPIPPDEPRSFWRHYWLGPPAEPLDVATAQQYCSLYQNVAARWVLPFLACWQTTCWTGPVGASGVLPGSVYGPVAAASYVRLPQNVLLKNSPRFAGKTMLRPVDCGPPGAAILAVRSARRAVAESPENPLANFVLAAAYDQLWKYQEQYWVPLQRLGSAPDFRRIDLFDRQTLRTLQFIAALTHCVNLDKGPPDLQLMQCHQELCDIYLSMHFLDLALEHLGQAREILADIPLQTKQKANLARQREELDRRYKALSEEVKRRRDYFDLKTSEGKQTVLGRFEVALLAPYHTTNEKNEPEEDPYGLGLARLALEILHQANVSSLPEEQKAVYARFDLTLLMLMGRVREAREGLVPGLKEVLPEYEVFRYVLGAVIGDYQQADDALAHLEQGAATFDRRARQQWQSDLEARRTFYLLTLGFHPPLPFLPIAGVGQYVNQQQFIRRLPAVPLLRDQQGALAALRGLLALEQGNTQAAREHFRRALRTQGPQTFFANRPIVDRYLELLNKNQ